MAKPQWNKKSIGGGIHTSPKEIRRRILGKSRSDPYGYETIEGFVKRHKDHTGDECVFVPGAVKGRPANMKFCGRMMAAARYMALLTHGTPKSKGLVTRHLCGNGHLSCVNPRHIVWGTPGDNQADANIHRALGEGAEVADRVAAAIARTSRDL